MPIAAAAAAVRAAAVPAALAEVRVPATSANLGPGYDALGVAVDVPLRAWVVPRRAVDVVVRGEGADELPADRSNLVWTALEAWVDAAGVDPDRLGLGDVSLVVDSAIPLEGGLGSSSAAAVAGVLLARSLAARAGFTGGARSRKALLDLVVQLEGHPDNAAAALHGGLVNCVDAGMVLRFTPSPALRPVLLWPRSRQPTHAVRTVLSPPVEVAAAAANGARAAATLAALAGLAPLDHTLMVDVLHEPARLATMATSRRLVDALRAATIPSCLSGAGPTVLAVVASADDEVISTIDAIAAADEAGVEVSPARWDLSGAIARVTAGPSG